MQYNGVMISMRRQAIAHSSCKGCSSVDNGASMRGAPVAHAADATLEALMVGARQEDAARAPSITAL